MARLVPSLLAFPQRAPIPRDLAHQVLARWVLTQRVFAPQDQVLCEQARRAFALQVPAGLWSTDLERARGEEVWPPASRSRNRRVGRLPAPTLTRARIAGLLAPVKRRELWKLAADRHRCHAQYRRLDTRPTENHTVIEPENWPREFPALRRGRRARNNQYLGNETCWRAAVIPCRIWESHNQ